MNPLCNCFALRQATRRVTRLYDQALAPVGIRVTQFSLLQRADALGPMALQPLAEVMVMGRATLGHNVRPLLAMGLVQLNVGRDRRSRELSVTQAGRDLLVEARKRWRQAQDSFETELGKDAASALRGLLHRVASTEFVLPGQEPTYRQV